MADIRLQLARYAQGIHWVQKNFLMDESVTALLVTAGPPGPIEPQQSGPLSPRASHVVLALEPEFHTAFPAPASWSTKVSPGLTCVLPAVESHRLAIEPCWCSALCGVLYGIT